MLGAASLQLGMGMDGGWPAEVRNKYFNESCHDFKVLANNTTLGRKKQTEKSKQMLAWLDACLTVMASPLGRHPCEWIISAPRTGQTKGGQS